MLMVTAAESAFCSPRCYEGPLRQSTYQKRRPPLQGTESVNGQTDTPETLVAGNIWKLVYKIIPLILGLFNYLFFYLKI